MTRNLFATFALAFALPALAATGGQAGVWEEFERRCLVPLETVSPPITEGLAVGAKIDGGRFWENRRGGWSLAVGERDGLTNCTLFVADAHADALASGYRAWADVAQTSGRYAQEGPSAVQSTEWREPRIEVHFLPADGTVQAQVWVMEVNVEA
ncbi:MAG: hypothetical protein AAGA08_00045 [Pseudomonadota bacterium]